jgi:argonaute-like protein implicated in RNA metabolism and viral defense
MCSKSPKMIANVYRNTYKCVQKHLQMGRKLKEMCTETPTNVYRNTYKRIKTPTNVHKNDNKCIGKLIQILTKNTYKCVQKHLHSILCTPLRNFYSHFSALGDNSRNLRSFYVYTR